MDVRECASDGAGWVVVVPVKGGDGAKSRLRDLVPDPAERRRLADALAGDTLEAVRSARSVARVVVVTDGVDLTGTTGLDMVPDPGGGLVAAVRAGVRAGTAADGGVPVGVLLGDLPALRPSDLDDVLTAARDLDRSFVPDAAGTGTTLLAARAAGLLRPRFGPGSAAAHRAAGHVDLDRVPPSVRQDVDTPDDLAAAAVLGLGPRTRAFLASHAAPPP
ncbi:2-phospho-L-lactate guanylyltransferase [Luteimicrobium subarcticum]|uniref:Phosphoenolpyruvate guanylyltransferase n=1 Tax=Luteimicrobium subarcticum TaxID=620910 RepID=A0A2M8WU77_9MICO|nr:2-phospho-L-lactate guanylyltransferase [Luteimicrobium subarcticum]PJI94464.1 2-phospho-L-lactate guanylyltransferase [Luteimicrobium subarcticum]